MFACCCEMVAILWLRQSGYLVDTARRLILEPQREFRVADDERVAEWLASREGYVRRTQ